MTELRILAQPRKNDPPWVIRVGNGTVDVERSLALHDRMMRTDIRMELPEGHVLVPYERIHGV